MEAYYRAPTKPHPFRKLLLLGLLAGGCWYGWRHNRARWYPLAPLYDKPYVVVYGREDSEESMKLRRNLEAHFIPYTFKSVLQPPVREELEPRMSWVGLSAVNYELPVVDVNAQLLERPSTDDVLARYSAAGR